MKKHKEKKNYVLPSNKGIFAKNYTDELTPLNLTSTATPNISNNSTTTKTISDFDVEFAKKCVDKNEK